MEPMRKRRPFIRQTENPRDTRLLVLATEDKHAVVQYFDFFHCPPCQNSSPPHLEYRFGPTAGLPEAR